MCSSSHFLEVLYLTELDFHHMTNLPYFLFVLFIYFWFLSFVWFLLLILRIRDSTDGHCWQWTLEYSQSRGSLISILKNEDMRKIHVLRKLIYQECLFVSQESSGKLRVTLGITDRADPEPNKNPRSGYLRHPSPAFSVILFKSFSHRTILALSFAYLILI